MRVITDRDLCIGAGNCVLTAPEVFDQGDDGLVEVREPAVAAGREQRVRAAVERCPSGAISLAESGVES
jgi:ferredoxin